MQSRNFYPGDCRKQVDEFLDGFAPPEEPAEMVAGIVPHAGWKYSGKIAARVWRTIAERSHPETIILLGAVHHAGVRGNSLYPEGAWETPLGPVEVDSQLASKISSSIEHLVAQDAAAHDGEHSLEVQMPFIKAILPDAKVVPIAVPSSSNAVQLGDLLGHLVQGLPVVAVGSSDLTHYGERQYGFAPRGTGPAAHEWLKSNDERLIKLLEELLAEEIAPEVATHHNACGPGALAATTAFARARRAEKGLVLEHATSEEVRPSGNFTAGVGYTGIVY